MSVGRAELSKRQDWSLEAAESLYQLVLPLLMYLVKTLRLDPNVLRDSTLQRLELLHMEAYLHVSATMWIVCFEELRRLTNSKKVEITPPELNRVYDRLHDVGTLLQGPNALDILVIPSPSLQLHRDTF